MSGQIEIHNSSAVGSSGSADVAALAYKPRTPQHYSPHIGLIACGGITETHLTAYRQAGFIVSALCDRNIDRAKARQREYYPDAITTIDYREVLARDDIEVVDIATHPTERAPIIEAALRAGKHVLSQKPFVLDLETGEKLVQLADEQGVKLAVNQNGRWAPHFSYLRHAVVAGLIGAVTSVDFCVQWDHNWIKDLPFNNIHHAALYDFAIHWFDMALLLLNGNPPKRVTASVSYSPSQEATPPLLAQALVECENAQATFVFNADTRLGAADHTNAIGTKGTMRSSGPNLSEQTVMLTTAAGTTRPVLGGAWFPTGFMGTMGELLCAIEENREPSHGARQNLKSLELCFAACASADTGQPQIPGQVRRVPESCIAR